MALTDNLVAFYKLNGNANSEVGGLNGTATGVSYVTGKNDQGAQFGTSGNKIALNHSALNLSAYTVNMWINTAWTGATREVIYSRGNTWANGQGVNFFLSDSSPKNISVHQGGAYTGSVLLADASADIPVNTWVMLTFTYNGTTIKFYINGVLKGSANRGYNSSTQESRLGLRGDGTDYYRGKMDDVGIWSRAISDSEVVALYNNGAGLTHPFTSTPANYNASFLNILRRV